MAKTIAFAAINRIALSCAIGVVRQWLPDGHLQGQEYLACNPMRVDRKPGSFKVNIVTGRWADFATGDSGGDLISLAAYLSRTTQTRAAKDVARMLSVTAYE